MAACPPARCPTPLRQSHPVVLRADERKLAVLYDVQTPSPAQWASRGVGKDHLQHALAILNGQTDLRRPQAGPGGSPNSLIRATPVN